MGRWYCIAHSLRSVLHELLTAAAKERFRVRLHDARHLGTEYPIIRFYEVHEAIGTRAGDTR